MELAKLDCFMRCRALGLSRAWVKVTLQLVNDPEENYFSLDVVPTNSSSFALSIPLKDDHLKLSSAFDQRSQSLAETLIPSYSHGTMRFCRLVRLQGFTPSGEPLQYEGRLTAMRVDMPTSRRIPLIGPSMVQDIERCTTVLKFGVPQHDAETLHEFAKTLNFHLGTTNEEWKPRSLSTVSSSGSLNMRTVDEALQLTIYQMDDDNEEEEEEER